MKNRIPLLCLSLVLLLCACNPLSLLVNTELTETHTITGYGIAVPTPSDWKPLEATEFDLYLGTDSETLFFGVFCYSDEELEGLTPAELFEAKNEMMLEESTKTTDIRAAKTETVNGLTARSRICKTEEGDNEYAYYFGSIEFDGVTVWFVGSTNTTLIDTYTACFDEILKSISQVTIG